MALAMRRPCIPDPMDITPMVGSEGRHKRCNATSAEILVPMPQASQLARARGDARKPVDDERGVWSHTVLAPSTRNIPTFNFMGEQSYGNQGEEVLRRAQEESLRHDEENTLQRRKACGFTSRQPTNTCN